MFEPFRRLDERSSVGLGLAVAKGFAEAMGGTIAAADTPGGGLTMRVSLPAEVSDVRAMLGADR
jgi:two-component system sensor histidine kinase KdpD